MNGLSNHTLLMNMLIGFSKGTPGWPSPLKEMGYKLDVIEPVFKNSVKESVHPDLVFSSNRHMHSIVFECKGGTCLKDEGKAKFEAQLKRYLKVVPNDLHDVVDTYSTSSLSVDTTLASTTEMAPLLKDYMLPLLVFQQNRLDRQNFFQNNKIEKIFPSSIELPDNPPTFYYPFSPDDEEEMIASMVFQEIVSLVVKTGNGDLSFDVEDICKSIHRCWKSVGDAEKTKIMKKVDKIITSYQLKPQLRKCLSRVKRNNWKITSNLEEFKDGCMDLIQELNEKHGVLQTSLKEWGENEGIRGPT